MFLKPFLCCRGTFCNRTRVIRHLNQLHSIVISQKSQNIPLQLCFYYTKLTKVLHVNSNLKVGLSPFKDYHQAFDRNIKIYFTVHCGHQTKILILAVYKHIFKNLRMSCVTVHTECNRRNGPDFGRLFLRSNYTDITQNTYIQSSMVTEILAREV